MTCSYCLTNYKGKKIVSLLKSVMFSHLRFLEKGHNLLNNHCTYAALRWFQFLSSYGTVRISVMQSFCLFANYRKGLNKKIQVVKFKFAKIT